MMGNFQGGTDLDDVAASQSVSNWKDWSGREDLNLRPPGPETKKFSQVVDFQIHVSGASTVQTHVIPAGQYQSLLLWEPQIGCPKPANLIVACW